MDTKSAMQVFSALAQPTRLGVVRLLVNQEPHGLAAGDLARNLEVPHNTMSAHLTTLRHAGLVSARRQSRSLIYRANLSILRQLTLFLLTDCCNGQPALCGPGVQTKSETPSCHAAHLKGI
jgi:ArsR family transcriptional regulator